MYDNDRQHHIVGNLGLIYVNGYGAPRGQADCDRNLGRYLPHVRDFARLHRTAMLVLCGGHTNRPDLSEAAAMQEWFATHAPDLMLQIRLIDTTDNPRDSLEKFAEIAGFKRTAIFFEETRRPSMNILARHFLRRAPFFLYGIPFDEPSQRWHRRLAQRTIKPFLELLALYFPWADRLLRLARKQHLAKVRAR